MRMRILRHPFGLGTLRAMTDRHVVALVLGALLVVPGTAAAATARQPVGVETAKPYFDSRTGERSKAARAGTTVAAARPSAATSRARSALKRGLGRQGVLSIDPLSGTPRQLLRTDGALSGPRGGERADIAQDFVRANRTALGLDAADLDGLDLQRRATTPDGLTVVHFRQLHRGIPAFDNDLRVAIDRAGRVLSVAGAPRHDLAVDTIEPSISGAEALVRLQRKVDVERSLPVRSGPTGARQTTTFAGGDFARLVLFGGAGGAKLAWHVTYRATSTAFYDAVVDATSGAILFRQNLTKAAAMAEVYPNHPGAGAPVTEDLEDFGLPAGSMVLDGAFSRQWADLDDDNNIDPGEETTPSSGTDFVHPFTPYTPGGVAACTATEPCAWDTTNATTRLNTKTVNRLQNGVQAFYLVSRFHDHLETAPIGFTNQWGNFQVGGTGGDDPVLTQTDDGVGIAGGPDGNHRNNANMSVPPDGAPPTMQMYLFRDSITSPFDFRSINGGDDSGVVWHEYTHGLSSRLVTNADGTSALGSAHSGAMGEGWSDWYASDLQVREGFKTDTVAPDEIDIGDYSDADPHALRSQALDCPVTPVDSACPGGMDTGGAGGYTLGDFGKILDAPEVHFDGEIWGETLWDLRRAVGSDVAEKLVTDGMRLSPPEPSMLDMRNAILAAEQANGSGLNDEVWDVFRTRGMGYFAAAADGSDTLPVEDFSAPPAPGAPKGTAAGVVTDSVTGLPLAGVRAGFGGAAPFVDETDASGRYTIPNMPAGSYPKLTVSETGYNTVVLRDVAITGNATTTRDIGLERNWASLAAGAAVADTNDDSGAPDCGVAQAFDQSQGTAWSAVNPDAAGPPDVPPTVTIDLPATVDVTAFLIDPTSGCGDDPSASTGDYRVETSTNGATFRTAVDGTGANAFTPSHLHQHNRRDPAGSSGDDTNFVRFTLLSPQSTGGAGADYIDLTELQVLGTVPNTLPSGSLSVSNANPALAELITFDATAITDPDSAITGYDWDFEGNGSVDRTTATPTTTFEYGAIGSFNPVVHVKDFRGGEGTATTPVTVTARAPGPPVGPGPPPPLGPLPSLSLPRTGKAGSIRPTVRCALRCSVSAKLVVSRATARKLKLKRRTLATFKRTLTTTERRRLLLRLPAKVRRAAKRAGLKTIKATLTVKATHAGGRSKTVRRTVRIKL